jgi:hypothetical protein
MASGKLHPIAERAFRAIGSAGKKALERAGVEAASTLADSLLEDLEQGSGDVSSRVGETRQKIHERKEEIMAGRKKGRRAAEEEDDDELEDEEVEEEEEEEEEDDEEEDEEDGVDLLLDAEVLIRNGLYILKAGKEDGKVPKKVVKQAEELLESIEEILEEA